jgi:hypothetical protein
MRVWKWKKKVPTKVVKKGFERGKELAMGEARDGENETSGLPKNSDGRLSEVKKTLNTQCELGIAQGENGLVKN